MAQLRPYIFLDFDGVLSVYRKSYYGDERVFTGALQRGRQMQGFLELIEARLVISSNWRYGQHGKGMSDIGMKGALSEYFDITYPVHATTDLLDNPGGDYHSRDLLILDFVKKRQIKAPWLAFDDMLLEKVPARRKVVTDPYEGVTENDFNLAIRRLDSQL